MYAGGLLHKLNRRLLVCNNHKDDIFETHIIFTILFNRVFAYSVTHSFSAKVYKWRPENKVLRMFVS